MIAKYVILYSFKDWKNVYNQMSTDTLKLSHLGRSHEVFDDEVILFTWSAPQVTR